MLKDSKLLFRYQSKGKKTRIPPLTQNYQDISAAVPSSTSQGAIHSVSVYTVSPAGMGFHISMAECRIPGPTPANGK